MKFNIIMEELLSEAMSPIEIHKKFYWDIPYKIYDTIVKSDPQTKVNGREIIKVGKFSKLLLLMYRKKNLLLEDLPKATEYLGFVYKYNIPLDLNRVTSLNELYDLVENYMVEEGTNFTKVLSVLPKNEYETLHNGNEWWVFRPLTERSACYLGVNTQWCTTWGPLSLTKAYRDRSSHFQRYSKSPIYIIINKNDFDLKYQFHFESKQYMDKTDREIDTAHFLENTPEIKHFFFPSFINREYPNIDEEFNKMGILSKEDAYNLVKVTTSEKNLQNPIIKGILTNDTDLLGEVIKDNILRRNFAIEMEDGFVLFNIPEIGKLYGEISDANNAISHYERQKSEAYEQITSEMRDDRSNNIEEWSENNLESLFEEFYTQHKHQIKESLGIIDYEIFKKHYYSLFINEEKISEEFIGRVGRLSESDYESHYEKEINEYERYVKIDDSYRATYVKLHMGYLIRYLDYREDVVKIENDLEEFINDYLTYYGLDGEPEYYPYIDYTYPTYGKDKDLDSAIDEFFDNILDKSDVYSECHLIRNKFNEIRKQLFKGDTVFENEHVFVELMSTDVDCEKGTVNIVFLNKDKNKRYEGAVKVENLASYVTNYQLFESLITFKKNIL